MLDSYGAAVVVALSARLAEPPAPFLDRVRSRS
jgi:hypothetical protein